MKTRFPLILILILTLASCSSEEANQADSNETLLKSYTLTRDSQGKYSIDYELKENTSFDLVKNIETNTNEVHLFSGDVSVSNKQSQTLSLENDQIQLGIYENGEEIKSMSVEDEEILFAKGEESTEFLETYSMTDLGNNNYQIDFKVKEGISVWYEYNEESDVYEVHLKEGISNGIEFSKTYIKTSDVLRVHFLNYIKTTSAKGQSAEYSVKEKPKTVTT